MRFNDISECATSGVLVTGASEPMIQKNTFRHCAVGVTVEDGGGAVLLENIISHSSTSALVPANAVGRTVGLADNRFTNNSGGGQ
jgi:parallel beta-helix repeat protein